MHICSIREKNIVHREGLNMNRTYDEGDYIDAWNLFVATGSNEAFSRVYLDNYDILHNIGLKYCSDVQVIEDSIQNVFINILKQGKKLQEVKNIRAYLIKSFRNQLLHELKKTKKIILSEQLTTFQFEFLNDTELSDPTKEANDMFIYALKRSLKKLSPRQQEIMYLRFDSELTYEEISNILDISVDSCYKSIYRSVKLIKEDIGQMIDKSKTLFLWVVFHFRSVLH